MKLSPGSLYGCGVTYSFQSKTKLLLQICYFFNASHTLLTMISYLFSSDEIGMLSEERKKNLLTGLDAQAISRTVLFVLVQLCYGCTKNEKIGGFLIV